MNEFRRLIAGAEPVFAPLVFNPISAMLAEAAGFKALYLGGGSMGYIKCGTEAQLSLTEMAQEAVDIRTVCKLPLILDGACGWGDPMHVQRTIRMSEAAGFCAIEIEDQILPKRAHHHIGIEHMIPSELMRRRSGPPSRRAPTLNSSLSAAPTRSGTPGSTTRCAGPRPIRKPAPTFSMSADASPRICAFSASGC